MLPSNLIAIVDDDAAVRQSLVRLLEVSKYNVRSFGSGEEFLGRWRTVRPACVLLDQQMPGLSGIEVQRELNRVQANIPVIIITGNPCKIARDASMREGAANYLLKPVSRERLLEAVEVFLE
jgi:FixJ family two-component response regulator